MSEKQPVHKIRFGRITAAIWENETEQGLRYNVTISRSYQKDEQWQTTTSFGRDDLHLVAKVADLAETWIFEKYQSE